MKVQVIGSLYKAHVNTLNDSKKKKGGATDGSDQAPVYKSPEQKSFEKFASLKNPWGFRKDNVSGGRKGEDGSKLLNEKGIIDNPSNQFPGRFAKWDPESWKSPGKTVQEEKTGEKRRISRAKPSKVISKVTPSKKQAEPAQRTKEKGFMKWFLRK